MELCTIALPTQRAAAAALVESFLATNSGAAHILLFDDTPFGVEHERVVVHRVGDVFPDETLRHRLGSAFIAERFRLAIRPNFLRVVAQHSSGGVLHLPPEALVVDSLAPIEGELRGTPFLVAPRTRRATTDSSLAPDGADAAACPIDDDILALGRDAGAMLDWWCNNIAHAWAFGARGAWHRDRDWLDRGWITAAMGIYGGGLLRLPGTNVGMWNEPKPGSPTIWADLRGFDPRKPHLLHAGQCSMPRVLLSEHPELRALTERYADALERHGWDPASKNTDWIFGRLGSGLPVNDVMRASYIKGCIFASNFGETAPPDPFEDDGFSFLAWLRCSRRTDTERGVSRYLATLWEFRPDLQATMPDIESSRTSALSLIDWARNALPEELDLPPELRPSPSSDSPPHPADVDSGVNVAGFLSSAKGLGEAGRAVLAAVASSGTPYSAYDFERTPARKEHLLAEAERVAKYDTNVICINAEMMDHFAEVIGPTYFEHRYNIGVWFWEAGTLNRAAESGLDLVDEIWVTAPYVADVFRKVTDKPIQVMPLPVTAPPPASTTRDDLGLPEGYMFLFVFDFFSTIERKNPIGLVRAFARAFAPGEGPILVLKSINGDKNLAKLEELRFAIGDREDIVVLDSFLPADQKSALINLCDCYVSLHRGEGFGLGMAEAMMLGKPVIGTGYSGNLAFMTEENSFLVDYELTQIVDNDGLYPAGGTWAEPSVEDAARLMRLVHDDPAAAESRAVRGKQDVSIALHPDRLTEFVTRRLAEISSLRHADPTPVETLHVPSLATNPLHPRQLARRAYWKLAGPLVRRIEGQPPAVDPTIANELASLGEQLQQVHRQLELHARRSEESEDAILLHAHAASEYARIAARRADARVDA